VSRRRAVACLLVAGLLAVAGVLGWSLRTPAGGGAAAVTSGPVSETDEDVLWRAEQVLTQQCMRRQGFRYWLVPRLPAPDYRSFPYVVDDVVWARAHGYGRDIMARIRAAHRDTPATRYAAGLSPAGLQSLGAALSGPSPRGLEVESPLGGTLSHSDKGCTTEAWRRLYGDAQEWFAASQVTANLNGIRAGMVMGDQRFRSAVTAWSRCMRGRGYAVTDPARLRSQRAAVEGTTAQRDDVRAATAEAECAHSTGLAATSRELDHRHGDVLEERHRSAFDALWAMQRAALPQARRVVAGTPIT
jgi:hypothetical protein